MMPDPSPSFLARRRRELLGELRLSGIRDEGVLRALDTVPREEFVLPADRCHAYDNVALPIGSGQTISQPLIVGLMTQLLGLTGVERVLEIGTGSGYQAAILSLLAAEVYSIEFDAHLAEAAISRLGRLGFEKVHVRTGDGYFGWPEAAPFDAVILTAVTPRPLELLEQQLKNGGVMVLPLEEAGGEFLVRRLKCDDGTFRTEYFGAVAFVPMRGAVRSGH